MGWAFEQEDADVAAAAVGEAGLSRVPPSVFSGPEDVPRIRYTAADVDMSPGLSMHADFEDEEVSESVSE